MSSKDTVRLDKWLWAVRLYRTRPLAVQACHAGHVKMDGHRVKPAKDIRIGDILTAQTGPIQRKFKVLVLLDRRVGAKQVPEYAEDLTPSEEQDGTRQKTHAALVHYPRGLGRPTKKQRRQLEDLL